MIKRQKPADNSIYLTETNMTNFIQMEAERMKPKIDSANFRGMNTAKDLDELVHHYDTWAPNYDQVSDCRQISMSKAIQGDQRSKNFSFLSVHPT